MYLLTRDKLKSLTEFYAAPEKRNAILLFNTFECSEYTINLLWDAVEQISKTAKGCTQCIPESREGNHVHEQICPLGNALRKLKRPNEKEESKKEDSVSQPNLF